MTTLKLETYSNRASTCYEEQCLEDSEIVKSLPTSTVKFFMPTVTYKLIPPVSTTIFSSYKFGNDLESDLIWSKPDSLPYKCNNSSFGDRHHKHIGTRHLRIIKNNFLRMFFH